MTERENYVAVATFREWMQRHMGTDDLRCLSEYGAQAGVPGLIYYRETLALYEAFTEEIEEIAQQYGGIGKIAIRSDAYGITQLINALVWTVAEHHARELIASVKAGKGVRHA